MRTTNQTGIRLSGRMDEVGFSDIVQIRNKVMAMRAEGLPVYSLHGGEPFFETPDEIKFAAVRALVENQTHYAPSSGLLPLREALVRKLAAKNAIHVTTDEVIATVGGSQGLFAAFQIVWIRAMTHWFFRPTGPLLAIWLRVRRVALCSSHHHGEAEWHSQHARAIRHSKNARHLLQHAAESQRTRLHAG